MFRIIKILFLLCGFIVSSDVYADNYTAPPEDATSHTIGDDSFVNVPLGHTFPLYGVNFTDSWMLANGVVMFRNPLTPGLNHQFGWCCNGLEIANLVSSQQDRYSYAIAPFWTDIIQKDTDGGFFSQTDSNSTKYWWHRLEEYLNENENSVSLEIFPDGNYQMEYGDLRIDNHDVFIGVMGDVSQGEYITHDYYQGNGNNNYIYQSDGDVGMGFDGGNLVCSYDPLSDQSCSGYDAAFLSQQCDSDSFFSAECSGYDEAFTELQCEFDSLYSQDCIGYTEAFIEDQLDQFEEEESYGNTIEDADNFGFAEFDDSTGMGGGNDQFFSAGGPDNDMGEETFDIFGPSDNEFISIIGEEFYAVPLDELPEIIIEEFQADAMEEIRENIEEVEEDFRLFEEELQEEQEEQFEEELFEEQFDEIDFIDEFRVLDLPVDTIEREEEFDEIVEEPFEIAEREEIAADRPVESKSSPLATRIASSQTRKALTISKSAVTMSQKSSEGSQSGGGQSQQQQNQNPTGSNETTESQSVSYIEQSAQNVQDMKQNTGSNSISMQSQQFFSADTDIFADMSGMTVESFDNSVEAESVQVESQSDQAQTQIEQNLVSTGTPVTGITIIPVEVVTVQTTIEPPRRSLAEVISDRVARNKMENSNKVASGQTLAIVSLQSSIDLGSYYNTDLQDSDFYDMNEVVYNNVLEDNTRLIYNLSRDNHGTIRKMIRSQYK